MSKKIFLFISLFFVFSQKVCTGEDFSWNQISDIQYVKKLKTTNFGILAGELDLRTQTAPYNGLYLSQDFGNSWHQLNLAGRGIHDIEYENGNIYVATEISVEGTKGLFISLDNGATFAHKGPNISVTQVYVTDDSIVIGTPTHGLWVSSDNGQNWIQKIGNGWYGPKIVGLSGNADSIYVGTITKVFKSNDKGKNFVEVDDLAGITLYDFEFHNNYIWANSSTTAGMVRSTDNGGSWEEVTFFSQQPSFGLEFYRNILYSGKKDPVTNTITIFYSPDFGDTWKDTGLNRQDTSKFVSNIIWLEDLPQSLLASVSHYGIFKATIPNTLNEYINPFLNKIFVPDEKLALSHYISAFFDHSYPLLGYPYHTEPSNETKTTLNFLGLKQGEPDMYYSSHNGTDFALPLNTPILAPADGIASYYFCKACGNTIKINHLNGFQSTYMHLSHENIITKDDPVVVSTGARIGNVGLTGNTSGPHVHFSIEKDLNLDGNFSNDFPGGNMDPYGWEDTLKNDPWPEYIWADTFGTHSGTSSSKMWLEDEVANVKLLPNANKTLEKNTVKVHIQSDFPGILKVMPYAMPKLLPETGLKYIPGTSFLINVLNNQGNKIEAFTQSMILTYNITNLQLENVVLSSLKIYFLNEVTDRWEPLHSILDLIENKISTSVDHLSNFAVFGNKIDKEAPTTTALIYGVTDTTNWYSPPVILKFIPTDTDSDQITTYFTLNNTLSWEKYTQPLELTTPGVKPVIYRSVDNNNNFEPAQTITIKIDDGSILRSQIKVINSNFKIGTEF